jgi:uncharacterized protein (TIGR02145 family)
MATKSKIQDQTFLFTGTLTEFTRDEAEALVETHGGKVLSGVSAKLNYLVVGEDAGSKLAKAKALGTVTILTEKEFLKLVPKGKSAAKKTTTVKPTKASEAKKETAKASAKAVVSKSDTKKVSNASAIEEVQIGKQIWMAKNLDVTHFRNGDPIPEAKNEEEWIQAGINRIPAWCNYDNNVKNGEKYGKLYNWHAIVDSRGIAPEGWRIPLDSDWNVLQRKCGGKSLGGEQLKSKTLWPDHTLGVDGYGFNALPSGGRNYGGRFHGLNTECYFWTASEDNVFRSVFIRLEYDDISKSTEKKDAGYSVRCLVNKG